MKSMLHLKAEMYNLVEELPPRIVEALINLGRTSREVHADGQKPAAATGRP